LYNSEVSPQSTDEGIIKIGKYITTQRKCGNGSRIKKPKIDPTHPGNQLQFKFKPKRVGVIAEM